MSGLILPDGTPASRLYTTSTSFERKANRLIAESSPYLLQHAYNPVDWQPYRESAFEEARRRDLPVLISIGYSSCHWCHVMEREAFEDHAIAELMNRSFVCVKVDREERPDIDQIYMSAIQALTGQGGWPLNVFVDHDGKPFFGGTYFPPKAMYGRPSWREVCEAISEAWQTQRRDVLETGQQLFDYLQRDATAERRSEIDLAAIVERARAMILETADRNNGGFGPAPKFPQPMLLRFLLEYAVSDNNRDAREVVLLTLEKMRYGGLFDQIGGGFARYSTDARWMVPHFEKMLYDNAQLVSIYLHAGSAFDRADLIETARTTLDWMLRELWIEDECGFASSFDADSAGKEGAFYVWSKREIIDLLGERDGEQCCTIFQVTEEGTFEPGQSILFPERAITESAARFDRTPEQLSESVKQWCDRLYQARSQRIAPRRDDKILTDWNGMALSALAAGAVYLGDSRYYTVAEKLATRLVSEWNASKNLAHSRLQNKVLEQAFALDFATVATGLIDLYQTDGIGKWIETANEIALSLIDRFVLPNGLVAMSEDPVGGVRAVGFFDQAIPSANSAAALLWLRLHALTNNDRFYQVALTAMKAIGAELTRMPHGLGMALQAVQRLDRPAAQWVIAGDDCSFINAVQRKYYPQRELALTIAPIPALLHDLCNDKNSVAGRTVLYRCHNRQCQAPIEDLANID